MIRNVHRVLVGILALGMAASANDKPAPAPVVRGKMGERIPIPAEFKELDVVAFFHLEQPQGIPVQKAKSVVVTVYKDAKIQRLKGGQREPAKVEDFKPGQRIEIIEIEEAVLLGNAMRIAPRWLLIGENEK